MRCAVTPASDGPLFAVATENSIRIRLTAAFRIRQSVNRDAVDAVTKCELERSER